MFFNYSPKALFPILSDAFVLRRVPTQRQLQTMPLPFKEVSFLHTTERGSPPGGGKKGEQLAGSIALLLKKGIRVGMI